MSLLSGSCSDQIGVNKFLEEMRAANYAAWDEILAAQIAAAKNEPEKIDALWLAFLDNGINHYPGVQDRDKGRSRQSLVPYQLKLSPAQVEGLLDSWEYWGSADFLPLLKREAAAPYNNPKAARILKQMLSEKSKLGTFKK
jgi:hypothetical protein